MKNSAIGIAAVLILAGLLCVELVSWLFQPRCAVSGCSKKAAEGSSYCAAHTSKTNYEQKKSNSVYNTGGSTSTKSKPSTSTSSGSTSTKSKPSTGTSGGSTSTKSKPSTSTSSGAASTKSKSSSGLPAKKSYSSSRYSDGYDDGYDDVYSDGEPDWDRYDTDDDYARGADDALDEYEEYGEDW